MYQVDHLDEVVELDDIPHSSVGAPCPEMIAGEHILLVKYFVQDQHPESDEAASVRFNSPYAHQFGPPNDEALNAHPLYERGLRPYGSFEVINSSWIRTLEKMNAVHPLHDRKRFMKGKRHFILTFHDTTFECIAESYSVSPNASHKGVDLATPTGDGQP